MPDLFPAPIVVSVVDAASFKSNTKNRIIKTHVFWANNANSKIKAAVAKRNSKLLKEYFNVDPFDTAPPPKISDKFEVIGGDDDFTFDDINEVIDIDNINEERESVMMRRTGLSVFASTKDVKYERDITVYEDHWILPDDNLSDFKKKIQVASGIPTYRQHLWYEVNGDVVCPCYDIHIGNMRMPTNIWNIKKNTSIVMGMPVDTLWYARRGEIRVYDNEYNVLLGSIHNNAPNAKWYVLDLNDIMAPHRKQFSNTISSDVHLRELVYFSFIIRYWPMITNEVFHLFVTNEPSMHIEYPELSLSDTHLRKQFNLQTSIIANNYFPVLSKIPMSVFVNETTVTVSNDNFTYGTVINLRNLFDKIVTTESMPYVKCKTIINNSAYTLIKRMKGGALPRFVINPKIGSLVIMFIISDVGTMFVYIYASGSYDIKTVWREDKKINLQQVTSYMISHANPILNSINKMGEYVLTNNLLLISPTNIDIVDAGVVITLNRRLTHDEFESLRLNMQKFKSTNIVNITSQDVNTISFYIIKGMHNFDSARYNSIINTTNGYSHNTKISVRQKWENVYMRQKACTLQNRTSDIYIVSSKLKNDEYSSFIRYMLMIIHMSIDDKTSIDKSHHNMKMLTHLKEIDPVLYDLKNIYNTNKMYSQICQKPNQPTLLSGPSKKSVKYWNFTTNKPAYYECPNPKYPVLYFKTSVHPQDYCIPCCKKALLSEGSKHEHIYSKCMSEHKYSTLTKNVIKSAYIISYGKELEPGRLSKLPESSLDQLFYRQYASTGRAIDDECVSSLGYYIYGVSQNIGMTSNVGVVNTFAHAMGLEIDKLVDETTSRILKNKRCWNLIMSGRIMMHFKSAVDFTAAMSAAFLSQTEDIAFDNWNDAFIDVARIFWGINIIRFVDNGKGSINVMIPSNVRNVDDILAPQYKHIILIQQNNTYLPIYLIDINEFKKNGVIATTVFKNTDNGIAIMRNMLNSAIEKLEKSEPADLQRMILFADDKKDVNITSIYINKKNVCYAILLTYGSDKIYFPVIDSLHTHIDVPKINEPFNNKKYNTSWARIYEFIKLYNLWAAANEVSTINVTSWISVEDAVIGFTDQFDMFYYYVSPMKIDAAKKIYDIHIIHEKYNPYDVNMIIMGGGNPIRNESVIANAMYRHYIYTLFVLEFMAAINKQLNNDIRNDIKAAIKDHINDPPMFLAKINAILKDWPNDIDMIHSIFTRFTKLSGGYSKYDDLIGYKNTNYSYNDIKNVIDNSRFSFDDIILPAMFKMNRGDLVLALQKFMSPLITLVDTAPNIKSFSNDFVSCNIATGVEYCSNNKLIVLKNKYDDFIQILADDILNPIKRRQLTNPITKSSVNNFKFITRPNENIFVSV